MANRRSQSVQRATSATDFGCSTGGNRQTCRPRARSHQYQTHRAVTSDEAKYRWNEGISFRLSIAIHEVTPRNTKFLFVFVRVIWWIVSIASPSRPQPSVVRRL